MTREEFTARVDEILPGEDAAKKVTNEEYEIIEQVYTFYPAISETRGKEQFAYLYVNFGMSIIRDMEARAQLMQEKEAELAAARRTLDELEDEIAAIRRGEEI